MRRLLHAAVITTALFAGAIAAPAAASAHHPQPTPQRFYADSGDSCRYGQTEGTLSLRYVHPPEPVVVDVSGVVIDRPVPSTDFACRDDGYYSAANFVAYADGRAVDKATERANNTKREFRFALGENSTSTASIDTVTVQVCRIPTWSTDPALIYCGQLQKYHLR